MREPGYYWVVVNEGEKAKPCEYGPQMNMEYYEDMKLKPVFTWYIPGCDMEYEDSDFNKIHPDRIPEPKEPTTIAWDPDKKELVIDTSQKPILQIGVDDHKHSVFNKLLPGGGKS